MPDGTFGSRGPKIELELKILKRRKQMKQVVLLGVAVLAGAMIVGTSALAQGGPPVKIGMTTALTGPYSEFGVSQKNVVEIAIEQMNGHGGIKGRRVELVSYDDGLVAARAQSNMRRLLEED